MSQPNTQQQAAGEDNSQRFARALPILLADSARWALQATPLLASLKLLCVEKGYRSDDWEDPRRGIMWVGGGDCHAGDDVYEQLETLQRAADAARFLGTLACVSTAARAAVAAAAPASPAEMEAQVAQAAAMTTLCAYAIDAEVMRELSIYQARACATRPRLARAHPGRSCACARRRSSCGGSCASRAASRRSWLPTSPT
jgi:hypothetical protein